MKNEQRASLRKSNLDHDYHAVNSIDGRNVVQQERMSFLARFEICAMYSIALGTVSYIVYCVIVYGAR